MIILLCILLAICIGYVVLWFLGDYRQARMLLDLSKRLPQSIEDYERDLEQESKFDL